MENTEIETKNETKFCGFESLTEKLQSEVIAKHCKEFGTSFFDAADYAIDCNIEYSAITGEIVEKLITPKEYYDALENNCAKSMATLIQEKCFTMGDFEDEYHIEIAVELCRRGCSVFWN